MNDFLTPGDFVRHPDQQDWGLGQVQSVIDGKITVNFEHAGKVVVPEAQCEHHPVLQGKIRRPEAAFLDKSRVVSEQRELCLAILRAQRREGILGHPR